MSNTYTDKYDNLTTIEPTWDDFVASWDSYLQTWDEVGTTIYTDKYQ